MATAPSPPRASRALLIAPLVLLALFALACSIAWLALRGEALRRLDDARAALAAQGYRLTWARRRVYGYPFRLDLAFAGAAAGEPTGWAASAPDLRAEAFVFAPGDWVIVAPEGLTVRRGAAAPALVARIARASLSHFAERPPRLDIEAEDVAFGPARASAPVALRSARTLLIDTRAGPNGQGALFVELDGARARLPGLLGRIVAGGDADFSAAIAFSRAAELAGRDWRAALRAWSAAGGVLELRDVKLQTSQSLLQATSNVLAIGPDGRLAGAIEAQLTPPSGPRSGSPPPRVRIDFVGGQTRLGPALIGPAPRVF
ncbi:MAG TPA: DUF2125 domain-containing protein [Caulobacteraceae bacterium]|nr:DUF2125 domain-containing protein [Caulobacteraceae bacterium]